VRARSPTPAKNHICPWFVCVRMSRSRDRDGETVQIFGSRQLWYSLVECGVEGRVRASLGQWAKPVIVVCVGIVCGITPHKTMCNFCGAW
jgi:hypothetical protein